MGINERTDSLLAAFEKMHGFRVLMQRDCEIPHREYMMLKMLSLMHKCKEAPRDRVKTTELSEFMSLSKPATSQILNSLEEKQLIVRSVTKTDRRIVYVSLSKLGEEMLDKQLGKMKSMIACIVEKLGEEDSMQLIRISEKLNKIITEMSEG